MNPYQKGVMVAVRTISILAFIYFLAINLFYAILNVGGRSAMEAVGLVLFGTIALYFLAKPIAWLATLGIK